MPPKPSPRRRPLIPQSPWRFTPESVHRLTLPPDLSSALESLWRQSERASAIVSFYRDKCFDPPRLPTLEAATTRFIFDLPQTAAAFAQVERDLLLAAALAHKNWSYAGETRHTAHAAALLFCQRVSSALAATDSDRDHPRARQLALQRRRLLKLPTPHAAEWVESMKSESLTAADRRKSSKETQAPTLLPHLSDIEKLKRAVEHLALHPSATKDEVERSAGYGQGYFSRKIGQRKWTNLRNRAIHIRKGFRRLDHNSPPRGDIEAIDPSNEE